MQVALKGNLVAALGPLRLCLTETLGFDQILRQKDASQLHIPQTNWWLLHQPGKVNYQQIVHKIVC